LKRRGVDHKQLAKAVEWSVRQLEFARNQRVDAIRQFVGSHYASGGAKRNVPVNMIELAVTIYIHNLVARAPRVMVTSHVDALRSYAANMALALNQIPDEIGLARTLQRAVLEALFGVGVVKVGICESDYAFLDHDVGEVFVDVVPLDDYFIDMSAKDRQRIQFEGNDYWLDVESARELQDGTDERLEPDSHAVYGENGAERAESVGADAGADVYREKVWLRDIWLPDRQELVTYGVTGKKVVRVVPWDGPDCGPYHTLGYSDVPGNILPLPPVSLWRDLHEVSNLVFRKLSKQAVAKKSVAAFQGGNDEDVEALRNAEDGDGIRYNGQKPETITVGGIDAPSLAFFLQSRDLFSYFAGNLDALGGLAPMSDTGVQDKLLSAAASARMDRMKSMTNDFVRSVFRSIAWYEWTDPIRERTVRKPIPGTDMVLAIRWSAETRDGDFLDYNFEIDPYSMQEDTPSTRLNKLSQALQQFIFPMLPMMQQQGIQLDYRALVEIVGRLMNVDELRNILVFSEPIQGDPQQGGDAMPKLANTTRTYERVNRPGATRSGKDDVLSRILMGGGVQGSEAASIGRPTT